MEKNAVSRLLTQPLIVALCLCILIILCAGMLIGGCTCNRTPRPAWESGLRQTEASDREAGKAAGSGDGTGDASGSGEGNASGTGAGNGPGSGGQGEGAAAGMNGAAGGDGNNQPGTTTGLPGNGKHAGSQENGSPIAGSQAEAATGPMEDATQTAAALPGQSPQPPKYDAATAARVAERHLRRARSYQTENNNDSAYDEAIRAFNAVEPHASNDQRCAQLLQNIKKMLVSLERERPPNKPDNVPTLFQ
ncbi:MAG: hypothetical protein ABGW78_16735 [Pirellulales bacterium]